MTCGEGLHCIADKERAIPKAVTSLEDRLGENHLTPDFLNARDANGKMPEDLERFHNFD